MYHIKKRLSSPTQASGLSPQICNCDNHCFFHILFSFLGKNYLFSLLNFYKSKNPAARTVSRRRDFLTKKGISTANPSYVLRKCFFLISYIYYTRFSGGRKFLSDFLLDNKKTRKSVRLSCCVASAVLDSDNVSAV